MQDKKAQVVQQPKQLKKAYHTPTLQTHGAVEQVTEHRKFDFSAFPWPPRPHR